jgi:hypothetical protein
MLKSRTTMNAATRMRASCTGRRRAGTAAGSGLARCVVGCSVEGVAGGMARGSAGCLVRWLVAGRGVSGSSVAGTLDPIKYVTDRFGSPVGATWR